MVRKLDDSLAAASMIRDVLSPQAKNNKRAQQAIANAIKWCVKDYKYPTLQTSEKVYQYIKNAKRSIHGFPHPDIVADMDRLENWALDRYHNNIEAFAEFFKAWDALGDAIADYYPNDDGNLNTEWFDLIEVVNNKKAGYVHVWDSFGSFMKALRNSSTSYQSELMSAAKKFDVIITDLERRGVAKSYKRTHYERVYGQEPAQKTALTTSSDGSGGYGASLTRTGVCPKCKQIGACKCSKKSKANKKIPTKRYDLMEFIRDESYALGDLYPKDREIKLIGQYVDKAFSDSTNLTDVWDYMRKIRSFAQDGIRLDDMETVEYFENIYEAADRLVEILRFKY